MSCQADGRGHPATPAPPRGSRKILRAGRDLRRWRKRKDEDPKTKPNQPRLQTPCAWHPRWSQRRAGTRAEFQVDTGPELERAWRALDLMCFGGSSGSHPGAEEALRARPQGLDLTAGEGTAERLALPTARPRALEAARPGCEFQPGRRAALCTVANSLSLFPPPYMELRTTKLQCCWGH